LCGELLRRATGRGDFGFRVGDRFEKLVNGVPIVQGRVVGVVKREDEELNHDRILTIEWDDGSQTVGRPKRDLALGAPYSSVGSPTRSVDAPTLAASGPSLSERRVGQRAARKLDGGPSAPLW
jgi:hypothetical protein